MGRAEEQAWPGQAVIGVLLEAMGLLGKAGWGGKKQEAVGIQLGSYRAHSP